MKLQSRQQYIDHVEGYFRSVTRADRPAVRGCFTEDAVVTLYHGDNPRREFFARPAPGQLPLEAFYGYIWENMDVHFGDFTHYVDVESERCASTFIPKLKPKAGSAHADKGVMSLNNCNFFLYSDGRIQSMTIYYANPDLGARQGATVITPTVPPM